MQVQGGHGVADAALFDQLARTAFAAAATGGHAQLQLDVVEAHPSARLAADFAVGHSVADTNNHGG